MNGGHNKNDSDDVDKDDGDDDDDVVLHSHNKEMDFAPTPLSFRKSIIFFVMDAIWGLPDTS